MSKPGVATDFAEQTPERVERLRRTAAELGALLVGPALAVVDRRPADSAWSGTEIVCHLRDVEEAYLDRLRLIVMNDEPNLGRLDPDRWVEERQYRRHDLAEAVAAFRARRRDTLAFLETLSDAQWEREGRHPSRGRLSVRKIVHGLAKHDTEHLEQLKRALAGAV